MSEGKEGPCGTAQLLEDILRACFGTILVEPIKWRIVSTATPYRSMLRNAIKSGKAAFPAVGRHSADAGEEKSARRDDQRGCRPALRQNEHQ